MGKVIDLTGQTFGLLTAIEQDHARIADLEVTGRGGKVFWTCKCACGRYASVWGHNLRSGHTQSCGCLVHKQRKIIATTKIPTDFVGRIFGRLTVIAVDLVRTMEHPGRYWICQCDCGRYVSIRASSLREGHTVSCGCWGRERAKANARARIPNLAGQVFGRLTVISLDSERMLDPALPRKRAYWLCECACTPGLYVSISGENLRKNRTASCGCFAREVRHDNGARLAASCRKPMGEAGRAALLRNYIFSAKARRLCFDLDNETFFHLTQQECYYCGQPPKQQASDGHVSSGVYIYNGIDRLDNDKGYSVDNCVTCCKTCNYAKRKMTKQEYIDHAKRVAERHKG